MCELFLDFIAIAFIYFFFIKICSNFFNVQDVAGVSKAVTIF